MPRVHTRKYKHGLNVSNPVKAICYINKLKKIKAIFSYKSRGGEENEIIPYISIIKTLRKPETEGNFFYMITYNKPN